MRIPGGWNVVILVFFIFSLFSLNYINVVPLYKFAPFSFLPHVPLSKVSKQEQAIILTPTPLPPLTIKKIDAVKGEGEFVINDPVPQAVELSPEKQILVDGIYHLDSKKITLSTTIINSQRSLDHSPLPLLFSDSSESKLRLEMISDGVSIYETVVILSDEEKKNEILFRTLLPFDNDFTIRVYDGSNTLLLSQPIKI